MALFGAITLNEDSAASYVTKTNEKFSDYNIVKNPFKGSIITKDIGDGELLHVVNISPLYFAYPIFGWLAVFIVFFMGGFRWNWLMLPGIILGSLCIFWTKYFYMLIYKIGIKKNGYKGKLRFIRNTKVIELLLKV